MFRITKRPKDRVMNGERVRKRKSKEKNHKKISHSSENSVLLIPIRLHFLSLIPVEFSLK